MSYINICGDFTDHKDACKFCEQFMLWGTCCGYCGVKGEDIHCNDTCESFKLNTNIFTENREFKNEDARNNYYE